MSIKKGSKLMMKGGVEMKGKCQSVLMWMKTIKYKLNEMTEMSFIFKLALYI